MLSLATSHSALLSYNEQRYLHDKRAHTNISSSLNNWKRRASARRCCLRKDFALDACTLRKPKAIARTNGTVLVRAAMDASKTEVKGKVLLIGITGVTGRYKDVTAQAAYSPCIMSRLRA
jgi:hypothetical protein